MVAPDALLLVLSWCSCSLLVTCGSRGRVGSGFGGCSCSKCFLQFWPFVISFRTVHPLHCRDTNFHLGVVFPFEIFLGPLGLLLVVCWTFLSDCSSTKCKKGKFLLKLVMAGLEELGPCKAEIRSQTITETVCCLSDLGVRFRNPRKKDRKIVHRSVFFFFSQKDQKMVLFLIVRCSVCLFFVLCFLILSLFGVFQPLYVSVSVSSLLFSVMMVGV